MFRFSHGADSDSDSDPVDLWRSMLVETGGLTREKADAIRAWFDDRPAFLVDADGEPIGDGPGHERCHEDDGGSTSISNDGPGVSAVSHNPPSQWLAST